MGCGGLAKPLSVNSGNESNGILAEPVHDEEYVKSANKVAQQLENLKLIDTEVGVVLEEDDIIDSI